MAIDDREIRQEVLDPERSFIVQAPAGSGKTELLVRRYLRLLQGVSQPEEIVAITFTRKAAAEMRERILDSLKSAESDPGGERRQSLRDRERWLIARDVLRRSDELGWRLTGNPARTRIQTVDSFCSRLVRQMPVLSRLGGQPEIVEDATELYRQAAENLLAHLEDGRDQAEKDPGGENWSDSIGILLEHLDNNLPRIRELIVVMLGKRDQWQEYVVGMQRAKEDPDLDLRKILEDNVASQIESVLEKARAAFPDDSIRGFVRALNVAMENLEISDSGLPLEDLPGTGVDCLSLWQLIASLCLTGGGTWRKTLNKNQGFPPGEPGRLHKERFLKLLEGFSANESLRELLEQTMALPEPRYSEEDWTVLEVLPVLLQLAYANLRMLFKERNQVDFAEISFGAFNALGGEDEPTDLALYLDHRIRHILVDEYQDISNGQYRLLDRLTAGWTELDGHSLFLVGDPMQSIYRFRDAEVGLFIKTWNEKRLGQMPVEPRRITVNFRSDAALVEWVNRAFLLIFPADSDSHMGAVGFTPAKAFQSREEDCGTILHPVGDDGHEADRVLEIISRIRESFPGDSVAILVRSRPHLREIIPLMVRSNTLFRAVEIEELNTDSMIQDLIALVRALHHEADRVAWLAVLRAPWCGLNLEDLLRLVGGNRHDTVWRCMTDSSLTATLSDDGRGRLERLCRVMQRAFELQGRMSLRRWVEGVWINLGGPATLKFGNDLVNAETFFDVLDEMDRGGDLRDRSVFYDRIGALYAGADVRADDTLQVMTIHKAKGLEFDHVILPGLSRRRRNPSGQLLLWSDTSDGLLVAPIKSPVQDSPAPIYEFIQNYERRRQDYEESRLLYVATTRARKQLHVMVSSGQPKPAKGSMLSKLWPVVESEYSGQAGEAGPDSADDGRDAPGMNDGTAGVALRRLDSEWSLPKPPLPVDWSPSFLLDETDQEGEFGVIKFKWAGQTIKHVGTIVHRCLQQMAAEGIERWDAARISGWRGYFRDSLFSVGVGEDSIEEAGELVRLALTATLEDPKGRWIMSNEHGEAKSEYALSGICQGNLVNIVIDRTFVDRNGTRWIVDYKTSRHESGDVDDFLDNQQERYRDQMERYAEIMSSFETRPIRLGLYFPLLKGWREWGAPEQ
ncbi:MAG: AAA family ATPase [Gammaproteobacteria bacterium]|nr:AAA family ATPase [Gammaproteobacteria bacterium]MYJ51610.1 AAA family ATPase [Gammaproteobacteria bacterium]